MQQSNVDTSFLRVSDDRPSTLAIASVTGGNARYDFYDEGSAGRMLAPADLPDLPIAVTAVHFGSFSLAIEPSGSTFEVQIQRESSRRVVSLDLNIRPALVHDRGKYLERLSRLIAMADIVKLSEEDLIWLKLSGDFVNTANSWLAAGARLVVLTRGAAGALAVARSGTLSIPSVPVKVADTIGAGDAFMAGVLARLASRSLLVKSAVSWWTPGELADALTFASKVSAITVSRVGADPPWAHEITDEVGG